MVITAAAHAIKGPVLEGSSSYYVVDGQRPPEVRVIAVVSVVAIDKDGARRNAQGLQCVAGGFCNEGLVPGLTIHYEMPTFDLQAARPDVCTPATHREGCKHSQAARQVLQQKLELLAYAAQPIIIMIPLELFGNVHMNIGSLASWMPPVLTSTMSPAKATTRLMNTSSAKKWRKTLLCSRYLRAHALS